MNLLSAMMRLLGGVHGPHRDKFGSSMVAHEEAEDDFVPIGAFPVHDANKLLKRLGEADVNFRIQCNTRPHEADISGLYVERQPVKIFIHRDDLLRVCGGKTKDVGQKMGPE